MIVESTPTRTPTRAEVRIPYRTRLNESRPALSVPKMCLADGAWLSASRLIWRYVYGAMKFANSPQPKMPISRTSAVSASRCRMKRRRAYAHWLRASTSRPYSYVSSVGSAGSPGCAEISAPGGATASVGSRTLRSVIADPRIEDAVEDVCDQVEEDHHRRDDHQPRHHRIRVARRERVDEVEAHAVEREDRLRDDRPGEESAEIDRHHRQERDQRVAKRVLHDDAALEQALGARGSDVVRVERLQHRRAHVPAVGRDAEGAQSHHRQREVLHPVDEEMEPMAGVDRRR